MNTAHATVSALGDRDRRFLDSHPPGTRVGWVQATDARHSYLGAHHETPTTLLCGQSLAALNQLDPDRYPSAAFTTCPVCWYDAVLITNRRPPAQQSDVLHPRARPYVGDRARHTE